jgi:hypothetical protein
LITGAGGASTSDRRAYGSAIRLSSCSSLNAEKALWIWKAPKATLDDVLKLLKAAMMKLSYHSDANSPYFLHAL